MHKEGFKGYSILSFCHSNNFFSLSSDILYQFILSSSFVSEVAIDAFTELLKLFYKKHSHVSLTKTTNLIVCFLGFIYFVFLIFRTLIVFLSQSYSFSQKLVVIILIVIIVGLSNTMISNILTDLITTLILGLAIPCILNILELLNQMEEFVKLFFFLSLCNNSQHPINIFCINFEEDKIWLDGPNVMDLTDPIPWANEELAQHSLKPIVGRYSKSPRCRVLAAYA